MAPPAPPLSPEARPAGMAAYRSRTTKASGQKNTSTRRMRRFVSAIGTETFCGRQRRRVVVLSFGAPAPTWRLRSHGSFQSLWRLRAAVPELLQLCRTSPLNSLNQASTRSSLFDNCEHVPQFRTVEGVRRHRPGKHDNARRALQCPQFTDEL